MTETPRFTVVAPMLNEAENVGPMAREIAEACTPIGPFEAIFVNDGSTDATARRIAELRGTFPWLREVRHARPCGQSAAVRSGVVAARAPLVCTSDGDGQNPPSGWSPDSGWTGATPPRSASPRGWPMPCARGFCTTTRATQAAG